MFGRQEHAKTTKKVKGFKVKQKLMLRWNMQITETLTTDDSTVSFGVV